MPDEIEHLIQEQARDAISYRAEWVGGAYLAGSEMIEAHGQPWPSPVHDTRSTSHEARVSTILERLPQDDAYVLTHTYGLFGAVKLRQRDMASHLDLTQASISYRLGRAHRRLAVAARWPMGAEAMVSYLRALSVVPERHLRLVTALLTYWGRGDAQRATGTCQSTAHGQLRRVERSCAAHHDRMVRRIGRAISAVLALVARPKPKDQLGAL